MSMEQGNAKMAISPRMTILFDNYPGLPGLEALWGFAAVFQPASIDLLFLSHPHWDHVGGLDSVLDLNP
jgi:7,8-dihydropterin-6-yl-methyl-4-(beta-D-ribofuranosyl)aminobenzene 5'-phosphate synthase